MDVKICVLVYLLHVLHYTSSHKLILVVMWFKHTVRTCATGHTGDEDLAPCGDVDDRHLAASSFARRILFGLHHRSIRL